ncbi:MAG TPA: imidazoleglycerol-phosphate dehydratase HisB [Clostridia bacterium]|nr:imidazoleglycerol-phosphate dehydratase HisB [Clostridia bacterium]
MRSAEVKRKTKETEIVIGLNLDGGQVKADTGIGFFDHMLTAFGVHGGFGLAVHVVGDLDVDAHHSVEDTGIVLGKAFAQALGNKSGIARFGNFYVPMDEALGFAAVDISGRPYIVFDAEFEEGRVGAFDTCLCEEFFRAFAFHAGITLHLRCLSGKNAHHQIEALFKAAAHALSGAVKVQGSGALSTKGAID